LAELDSDYIVYAVWFSSFQNISNFNVPDGGFSRNVSCATLH